MARWRSKRCGEGGASNLYGEVDEPPHHLVREAGTDETGEVEEGPAVASERKRVREREECLRVKEREAVER